MKVQSRLEVQVGGFALILKFLLTEPRCPYTCELVFILRVQKNTCSNYQTIGLTTTSTTKSGLQNNNRKSSITTDINRKSTISDLLLKNH